jgi:phytanoyl-CoA hydroxylase
MLTDADIIRYHEDGFLIFEGLLQGALLDKYVALFDELVEEAAHRKQGEGWTYELDDQGEVLPERLLHKIQGVCYLEPRALEVAKEPCITDRVAALAGQELDVFGTKFFPKLANGGTSTNWHQDNFYFGTSSDRIVTCGIYLQDTDRENGCLKVVPGSHKQGEFEHKRAVNSYGSWVDMDNDEGIDVDVSAGTVVLFSANLLHGAHPNVSQRSRYSTAWHYIPGDFELEQFARGEYADRHVVRSN